MVSESLSYASATAPPMTAIISDYAQPSGQRLPRGVYAPSPRSGLRPVLEHGHVWPRLICISGAFTPLFAARLEPSNRARVWGLKPRSEKGHEWPSRRVASGRLHYPC
jgi:hypothetical protein